MLLSTIKINCAIGILFSLFVIGVSGQETTGMSADQSLRSNARVNPSSLGMELSIPLAAYPGRGQGVSVGISYSSKLWRMQRLDRIPIVNTSECRDLSTPKFGELSASGWTTDAAVPYIEYTGLDNQYDADGKPTNLDGSTCVHDPAPNGVSHVRRIIVHMPGGGTHELWASTNLIITQNTSTYNINNVSWNAYYYSADGSNLIFHQDSTTSPQTYRLYLPDGTRMDFNESTETTTDGLYTGTRTIRKAIQTIDRNGNKITYHGASSGHPYGYITDTMGRVIDSPIGLTAPDAPTAVGEPQTYTVPGMDGGSPLVYGFHWRRLDDVTSDVLCYRSAGFPYTGSQLPSGACKLFDSVSSSWVAWDASAGLFNPVVLAKIDLPNGTSYEFEYDKFGRIDQITYPTGAIETFDYSLVPSMAPRTGFGRDVSDQVNYGVTHREILESAGAAPIEWNYSITRSTSPASYMVTTDAPDGTKTESLLTQGEAEVLFGFDSPLAGMPYEERFYDSNDNLMSKKVMTFAVTGSDQPSHPRTTKVESIVYDPANSTSLSSSVATSYATIDSIDDPLLSTSVAEYAFTTSIGSLGSLERTTETDYLSDSNYSARNLRSLPSETRVKDASGNVKAKSQIFYDTNGGQSLLDESESNRWENPSTTYRGLVTKTRKWHDITNNLYIDTSAQYDMMGNLRKAWDGNGNMSESQYSSTYDYTYPTLVLTPKPDTSGTYGLNDELETSTTYDYNTGLVKDVTDPNGAVTKMEYADPLLRPTKVTTGFGTSLAAETITEYGAATSPSTRWVKVKSQIDSTNWKETISWSDGLGRNIRSQSVDAEDGDVFALTCYDTSGRVSKTSNPFRGYSSSTHNCSTANGTSDIYWTANTFDTASRPWKVTTPDGAIVETTYSLAATGGYLLGTAVTVKDQADKQRRSITNALGQLKRVDEPTTSGLGSLTAPNQDTTYAYDTLNNLTTVTQGAQTRTFAYDALSRLKSAVNPESGTISYGYDNNGNLSTKTDARSITTTYSYDKLNRVFSRDYSDSTPDVLYYYDNLTNAKGKLTKVSSSVSTTEYTAFDILGRVTGHKQTTDGVDYTTSYTYKLNGALEEETYPSGRVVKNVLDASGDLAMVESKKTAASGYWAYARAFSYTAAGAVTSMQLGNGRWESTTFNSRLQPTQIALGTLQNGTDKLDLDYGYGTTANNGNVLSQTITVPTVGANTGFAAVQTYNYDELNRLKDATENVTPTGGGSSQSWKQEFSYDRYGNRSFVTGSGHTTTLGGCTTMCNPTFSSTTNRITSSGYTFDSSGNTTADPSGLSFTYDGENKQVSASNGSGTLAEYSYDGDGKRVKKTGIAPGTSTPELTIFVYDAVGKQIAEYSTVVANSTDAKVNYLTNDYLGSPRINTDAIGAVIARHDYHPFGEVVNGSGGRTTGLTYSADSVRKQFTGYERDNEINLDFAQARYYANPHGRFTSVDPYNIIFEAEDAEKEKRGEGRKLFDAYISQPQNWNRYAYVWNNPLRNTDPDGEKVYVVLYTTGNSGGDDEFRRAAETKAQHIREDGKFDPKKDTVLVRGVRTKEDAQTAFDDAAGMEKDYGKIQQVQIFSHADKDGPVFHPAGTGPSNGRDGVQWSAQEVRNLRINWGSSGAEAFFFGCNTAGFAQTFANSQNVTSYGYDRFAYFSSSRSGYRTEPQATGPLYLVGADGGKNGLFAGARHAFGYGKIYLMVKKTPRAR